MKKTSFLLFPTIIMTFIFPIILGLCFPRAISRSYSIPPGSENANRQKITCLNTKTKKITEINLEDYIPGVLAAEMPASFELEALKAQAVAARSYILSKLNKENPEHPQAVICTDATHCKGWLSEDEAKERWEQAEQTKYWQKLMSAAIATSGEYMTHNNNIIEACFFASGGSRTENSEDVWQSSQPYLRSVENYEPYDESLSHTEFTNSEFMHKIAPYLTDIQNAPQKPVFSEISRTNGGSVAKITVCGKTFKGTEIRSIFGLKSANFTVTSDFEKVVFDVVGSGHGVGMSQRGANQMAKDGKTYDEILSHYYTDIQIVKTEL